MDNLVVGKMQISGMSLCIFIKAEGRWERYLKKRSFFCEYNRMVEGIPKSIAIIPLLGNLLPISWVYDLDIYVEEIDKSFYDYLPQVMEGYRKMYPDMRFTDHLKFGKLVDNRKMQKGKSACFFSGGVDAWYTFLCHREEYPALATVWGSDIALDDEEGWKNVHDAVAESAEKYHVESYTIKSDFRDILDAGNLNQDLRHPGWSWWHEFQHGMGLITLMAPMAYVEGIEKIYIASSYTADIRNLTCASDPTIDNYVKFNNCRVIHDGFEADRLEKVRYIVDYSNQNKTSVELRVCWESRGGRNCCVCEKCCRTMAAVWLENGNLNQFGFRGKEAWPDRIALHMKCHNRGLARDWDILHKLMLEKYLPENVPKPWKWFYEGGTDSINHNFIFKVKETMRKGKRRIAAMVRGIGG